MDRIGGIVKARAGTPAATIRGCCPLVCGGGLVAERVAIWLADCLFFIWRRACGVEGRVLFNEPLPNLVRSGRKQPQACRRVCCRFAWPELPVLRLILVYFSETEILR